MRFLERDGIIYTDNQADGAVPNGTRVLKQNSEKHDAHKDGTRGTIIGSIKRPPGLLGVGPGYVPPDIKYFYFVMWDDGPHQGVPVGCVDRKIRKEEL